MDALEIFRKNSDINIILTDINMPVMDGFELIERVRIDNKDVAIIAMTAICTDEQLNEIMAKGANKYLSKPLDLPQLKLTLKESLESIGISGTEYNNITNGSAFIPHNM